MGRRQRSRRQRLILDLVLGLIVLGLGCVGLFVAWQIRPAEFRNQPSGGAVPEVGEIQVTRMADTPDWLARGLAADPGLFILRPYFNARNRWSVIRSSVIVGSASITR
jgi:hypothetical protein